MNNMHKRSITTIPNNLSTLKTKTLNKSPIATIRNKASKQNTINTTKPETNKIVVKKALLKSQTINNSYIPKVTTNKLTKSSEVKTNAIINTKSQMENKPINTLTRSVSPMLTKHETLGIQKNTKTLSKSPITVNVIFLNLEKNWK